MRVPTYTTTAAGNCRAKMSIAATPRGKQTKERYISVEKVFFKRKNRFKDLRCNAL